MLIIAIIVLAIVLLVLLGRPRTKPSSETRPDQRRREDRAADGSDGLIYGETPDGTWQGGTLPDDFTPGGGSFGGAGSSAGWGDSDGGGGDD